MRISWIATDIDGTFLDHELKITPELIDTYKKLQASGVPVVVSTGRSLSSLQRVLTHHAPEFARDTFKFCPGVYCNGAIVVGDDETDFVHLATMPTALIRKCGVWKAEWQAVSGEEEVTLLVGHSRGILADRLGKMWGEYQSVYGEEAGVLNGSFADESMDLSAYSFTNIDILLSADRMSSFKDFVEAKLSEEQMPYHVQVSGEVMFHVVPKDINKYLGLQKLRKRYPHLSADTWMALGDQMNDYEMLKFAPLSVAMGQASDMVKSAALHVTLPSRENGWIAAIQKFVLAEPDTLTTADTTPAEPALADMLKNDTNNAAPVIHLDV